MRIYLVGFMGSGKSTVGRLLAQKLGYKFVDTDEVIEQEEQIEISKIFSSKGEDYFRHAEHLLIQKLKDLDMVVATGGGLPCFFNNMDIMASKGIVIFLEANPLIISERLQFSNHRPLLHGIREGELIEFVQKMIEKRRPCYQKASRTINAELLPEEVVEDIITQLKDHRGFTIMGH